jgi:hypothetical protein
MADEPDLDMAALERALAAGEAHLQESSELGAAPSPDEPMEPALTEALASSPGRPSESYEPDFPNWALEGSNAKKLPGNGLACVTCPEAVWMTGGEELQAFCRMLRAITWSTLEAAPMQIEICTGKEMAIVAMAEAQAREEMRQQLQPSR